MKKILILIPVFVLGMFLSANAQLTVNPKIGIAFMNLSDPPEGYDFSGEIGFQVGADLRIGDRLFIAPGLYYMQTSTAWKYTDSSSVTLPEESVKNNYMKIKATLGYNLVETDLLKFRIFAAPSYDVHLSTNSEDKVNSPTKDDFKSGVFNAEAGLGLDIAIVSIDLGYSYGLTDALEEFDSTHLGFFALAGVAIRFGGHDNK